MAVKSLFDGSNFLREKTVLPPDLAFSSFGQNFTVEEAGDGYKISAAINGQPILSRAKPGELATPEEALEAIIEAYPLKDRILKAPGGGSGAQGGNNSNSYGAGKLSPEAAGKLSPEEYVKARKEGKI